MIIELLRSGQSARFIARGGSMWPSVPARSQIEVEPCPAAQLRVGQLAAFERGGQVIVHRVTRVAPEGLHFQGDNLDQPLPRGLAFAQKQARTTPPSLRHPSGRHARGTAPEYRRLN